MKATIEGNELVIRVPMNETPTLSSTGKTFLVAFAATTADGGTVLGLPVKVQVTATVKNAKAGK